MKYTQDELRAILQQRHADVTAWIVEQRNEFIRDFKVNNPIQFGSIDRAGLDDLVLRTDLSMIVFRLAALELLVGVEGDLMEHLVASITGMMDSNEDDDG